MPNPLSALLARARSARRRWWALAAVVILGAAAGGWALLAGGDGDDAQSFTATVSTGTYKTTVSATGTITPKRQGEVAFASSGTITAVAVEVGDRVGKGDVLARIDATALIAQREAAQSQVDAALAQLSEDAGGASAQVSADEASLAAARSQLAEARDAVSGATLRAPFAGQVSAVGYEVGDQVGSTGSSGGATVSAASTTAAGITMISPRALVVDAYVSASDVGALKTGMQAEITPNGGTEVVYGTLSEVGVIASASDTGAAQFPVTVEITGAPTGLYPGASAELEITVEQADDVLTVPTMAVNSDDGGTYVYLIENGDRVKREITVGTAYGAQTEVLSGLEEGDTVEVVNRARAGGGGGAGRDAGEPGENGFPGGGFPDGGSFPGGEGGFGGLG